MFTEKNSHRKLHN